MITDSQVNCNRSQECHGQLQECHGQLQECHGQSQECHGQLQECHGYRNVMVSDRNAAPLEMDCSWDKGVRGTGRGSIR